MARRKTARRIEPPSILPEIFGLDLRSLAAFRLGMALFVLFDLYSRSWDLTAHYTDVGVMPRSFVTQYYWNPAFFSVHLVTGTATGIAILFAIQAIAAVGLLVGYRTRLMTFVVWFLVTSLQTRQPLVLSAGDDLLRIILFFAIFLPIGKRYSIDAKRSKKGHAETSQLYTSPSTAIYYFQYIAVYVFTALLKSGPEWRTNGTAIYYALSMDQYVLPLGKLLLNYPELLKVLTFSVWWLELLGTFIFLIPHPYAKLLGILLFGGLHLGFGLTLALGHFPWVNAVALLPFIPSLVWDKVPGSQKTVRAEPKLKFRWWVEGLAIFFFVCVLIYNLAAFMPMLAVSRLFEFPTVLVRLDQYWNMFAPSPSREDGWYVIEGQLDDGSKIDAFRDTKGISYEKPASADGFYPDERWRKYMMNIWLRNFVRFRQPFAGYLCWNWNKDHSGGDHMIGLRVYFMLETTPPPGEPVSVQKLDLLDYACPAQ
jgi:hypothetical protein